jgi:hypothetical protein
VTQTNYGGDAIYLTPGQVQHLYGIGGRLLRSIRQRRLVRFARVGHRSILVDRASLERFLQQRASPALGERR